MEDGNPHDQDDLFRHATRLGGEEMLTDADIIDIRAAKRRVLKSMLPRGTMPGPWRNAIQVRRAAGKDGAEASEGLRRLRELRAHGFVVERRVADGRLFEYRIARREEADCSPVAGRGRTRAGGSTPAL